jgi:Zn-finger nucleic acid-binding protein
MSGGYRSARACPACAAVLTELSTVSAVIDRCPGCGGLWIEWFDGEISSVASGVEQAPLATSRDGGGTLACPDCRTTLEPVRYPDERSGAEILRCGACAGAFVPRDALDLVAALGPPTEPAPAETSWLASVVQRIRAALFGKEPS